MLKASAQFVNQIILTSFLKVLQPTKWSQASMALGRNQSQSITYHIPKSFVVLSGWLCIQFNVCINVKP